MIYAVDALLTGRARRFGARGEASAIDKTPALGARRVGFLGIEGDEQADLSVHGGPDKAVHHYPRDHYPFWAATLGDHALLDAPGAFGENVSTIGLVEDTACLGDRYRLGSALVEISQGRQPCWKLNERFGRTDMARLVQSTGRTGWYYRVLEPGIVAPQDSLVLEERRAPEWTLARIWRAFYVDTLNRAELSGIAALERLAEGWRDHARRRLESNRVEDWSKRLDGGA